MNRMLYVLKKNNIPIYRYSLYQITKKKSKLFYLVWLSLLLYKSTWNRSHCLVRVYYIIIWVFFVCVCVHYKSMVDWPGFMLFLSFIKLFLLFFFFSFIYLFFHFFCITFIMYLFVYILYIFVMYFVGKIYWEEFIKFKNA